MSYTKGKWDWSEKEDMTHGCSITVNGAVIATVDGTDEEMQANARLIAAAPALLDACKEGLAILDVLPNDVVVDFSVARQILEKKNKIKAAITEATKE